MSPTTPGPDRPPTAAEAVAGLRAAADASRSAAREAVDALRRERAALDRERRARPGRDPATLAAARARLARAAREEAP